MRYISPEIISKYVLISYLYSANEKVKKQCLGQETKNVFNRFVSPKIKHRPRGLRKKMKLNFWRIRYPEVIESLVPSGVFNGASKHKCHLKL